MKSVSKFIVALIVLALAATGLVPAQNAEEASNTKGDIEALILETDAEDARIAAQINAEKLLRLHTDTLESFTLQELTGAGRILVVPTTEINKKELAAIMQDMNIMARIFDKKLNRQLRLGEGESIILGGLSTANPNKQFFSGEDKATKAIYVGGYGALFFIKVNFPLSPPQEVKVKKFEGDVDPVWENTKQEIYTPKEAQSTIHVSPDDTAFENVLESLRYQTSVSAGYDAEKVDELKRKLTKTLKHAANIRKLNPQDWIILVVSGTPQPVVVKEIRVIHNSEAGKTLVVTPTVLNSTSASVSSPVLTIRVKKSDIDAFSKDELDFDKFRERTRILTSRAKLGTKPPRDILFQLGVQGKQSVQ